MSNEPDKVNSGALATMIVIVALATWGVALVVTSLVRGEVSRLRADGDLNQERPYRQLRAEQETKLNAAPAWADKEAGLARLPMSKAEALVIDAIRANPLALSPGNPPEEEEEEEPTEDGESAKDDSDEAGSDEAEAGESAVDEKTPEPEQKTAPTAPAPKTAPALKTAPAPVAPQAAPAPKAAPPVAPAPGGPAQ